MGTDDDVLEMEELHQLARQGVDGGESLQVALQPGPPEVHHLGCRVAQSLGRKVRADMVSLPTSHVKLMET